MYVHAYYLGNTHIMFSHTPAAKEISSKPSPDGKSVHIFYICIYMHICIYMFMYNCMYIKLCKYLLVYMCLYVCIFKYLYMCREISSKQSPDGKSVYLYHCISIKYFRFIYPHKFITHISIHIYTSIYIPVFILKCFGFM
jgi:hypothetical protein